MGGDGKAMTTRQTRSVQVVLFLVGVLVMLLVGPPVAPKGFRGSILLSSTFTSASRWASPSCSGGSSSGYPARYTRTSS